MSMKKQLLLKELENAEMLWLREVQTLILTGGEMNQMKVSLRMFAEKGVCRYRGRLENSQFPYEAKCPALLPPKNHLMSLIISECHEVMHRCVKDILTELRSRFWISKGRQVVKAQL